MNVTGLLRAGLRVLVRELERSSAAPRTVPPAPEHAPERPRPRRGRGARAADPGRVRLEYAPRADGRPDPGEVVWAWVPFEEDDGRGKDRPVLVVGRDGDQLVGFMMTSKDHVHGSGGSVDGTGEGTGEGTGDGRVWLDVGTGAWDRRRRPSEVRLDRVLRVAARDVRREGSALDRARFEEVAERARSLHGW